MNDDLGARDAADLAGRRGEPGPHTLGRWIGDRARLAPDHVAVEEPGGSRDARGSATTSDQRGSATTYAELDARSTALAERLLRAGYLPGDRVATLTRNSVEHVVLFFACARAGLVLAPMSWRLSPEELAYQLRHSRAALLVVGPELTEHARTAVERLETPPAVELLGRDGIELQVPGPQRIDPAPAGAPREVRDDDPLLLIYTSGTSRAPKGAVLTHANCFWTNMSLAGVVGLSTDDVVLAVLPQFHVGGWNIQPLLAWRTGATVVLEHDFDSGRALRLIGERQITTMMAVPTMYRFMSQHPEFGSADLSSLRYAVVGGAPMPPDVLAAWEARGVRVLQGYGLTEAGPNVLVMPAEAAADHVGSVGKPYPYVDVALRDPMSGAVLQGPGRGELLVRGPALFAGYFRDPEATAAAMVDGWLRTGDYVERDADGFYRVVDRLRHMYISGGENVSPVQVEVALVAHPEIADAAVVGVPDARWGEVGHAFVVRAPGSTITAEDVIAHCRGLLASFKAPRGVTFVDELPRTALHKLNRSRLVPPPAQAPAPSPITAPSPTTAPSQKEGRSR